MNQSVHGIEEDPESTPVNPPPPPRRCCKFGIILMRCISRFWTNYVKVDRVWLQEVRGHLITASALTATMAYQSILSPPGGFWQESKDGGAPGRAILDSIGVSKHDNTYAAYLILNSIVLIASLSTIMLAMTGLPTNNKLLTWLMTFTVYITISCMTAAYVLAVSLVFPEVWSKIEPAQDIIVLLVVVMVGLCLFVLALHSSRFFVWLGSKLVKLVKACCRCC